MLTQGALRGPIQSRTDAIIQTCQNGQRVSDSMEEMGTQLPGQMKMNDLCSRMFSNRSAFVTADWMTERQSCVFYLSSACIFCMRAKQSPSLLALMAGLTLKNLVPQWLMGERLLNKVCCLLIAQMSWWTDILGIIQKVCKAFIVKAAQPVRAALLFRRGWDKAAKFTVSLKVEGPRENRQTHCRQWSHDTKVTSVCTTTEICHKFFLKKLCVCSNGMICAHAVQKCYLVRLVNSHHLSGIKKHEFYILWAEPASCEQPDPVSLLWRPLWSKRSSVLLWWILCEQRRLLRRFPDGLSIWTWKFPEQNSYELKFSDACESDEMFQFQRRGNNNVHKRDGSRLSRWFTVQLQLRGQWGRQQVRSDVR